ncbi:MAG: RNase P modulator RnpM [Clostridia bacterium]
MKKIPQRTCMACNQKKDKNELIRIVKNKNNEINIDKSGKMAGRGAYICNDINCLEKVVKSKRLEKVLETNISDEIYKSLRGVILEK